MTNAEEVIASMIAFLRLSTEERAQPDADMAWQEAKEKFLDLPIAQIVAGYTKLAWASYDSDNEMFYLCERVLSAIGSSNVLRTHWSRSLFEHISRCDYAVKDLQKKCDVLERNSLRVGRKPKHPQPERPPAVITGMRPTKHLCDALVQLAYLEYERSREKYAIPA